MLCWMNGEFIEAEQLRISPFDHGFLYGAGFFETFRTYKGHVFLFEEHMQRLQRALQHFRITLPYTAQEILEAVKKLYQAAGEDAYFRLNVSAGVHDIGLAPTAYTTPNVILFCKPLPNVPRGTTKKGVFLQTPRREAESSKRYKSQHYLNNIEGRFELSSMKTDEGLFLTADGNLSEGVTSNLFWVKSGELYTPSEETSILDGTTRQFVIQLAKQIGMPVHVGVYPKEALLIADEVFVTNAIQELVPLSSVGDVLYAGCEGCYYQRLHEAYVQTINERIG